jgi:hypothetical protein
MTVQCVSTKMQNNFGALYRARDADPVYPLATSWLAMVSSALTMAE